MTGFQRFSRMKYLMPSDITTDPRERNVLDVGIAKTHKVLQLKLIAMLLF